MFVAYICLFMFVHIRTPPVPLPSVIWIDPKSEITIDHFGSDPGSGLDDPSVYVVTAGEEGPATLSSSAMTWAGLRRSMETVTSELPACTHTVCILTGSTDD